MAGPVLYSTNSWMAHDIATRYRGGEHFVWCSEHFDPSSAASASSAAAIAPSSSPKGIYETLRRDYFGEDQHSALIKGYKKTFRRLAVDWLSKQEIDQQAHDEIVALMKAPTWRAWRPVLFVIPLEKVQDRVVPVPRPQRAAHGSEYKIFALKAHEFDMIELY